MVLENALDAEDGLVLQFSCRVDEPGRLRQLQLGLLLGLVSLLFGCLGPLLQLAGAVEPVDDTAHQVNARGNEEYDAPLLARLLHNHIAGEQWTHYAGNGGKRITNAHQDTGMLWGDVQVIDSENWKWKEHMNVTAHEGLLPAQDTHANPDQAKAPKPTAMVKHTTDQVGSSR